MEREDISVQIQTPFVQSNQNPQTLQGIETVDDDDGDTHLDKALQGLDLFLTFLGFHQTSVLSFCLSWVAFVVVGIGIPVGILELNNCSGCEDYQVKDFEFDCLASQACLGAFSLICLSYNLRKYGIRNFLFVDRYTGHMSRLMHLYVKKIKNCYRVLILWLLPCLILKTAREVIRIVGAQDEPWWQSAAIVFGLVISWTYLNTISLAACILFHLICNLQVIHFEDYCKLLERETNNLVLMEEHIRLRHHLSKISHRFRIYLLLIFLVVTATQFLTLLQTTGYSRPITFLNGGDFAVTSVVQVVGITLCLHAATKISHRAQAVSSVAGKWHALITNTTSSESRRSNGSGNIDTLSNGESLSVNHSESDLDSLDCFSALNNTQLASLVSSYHKRESFVVYLQTNPGGITIFGWTVDRALICTIFFIELSLVLFVLGKTVAFSIDPVAEAVLAA